MRVIKHYSSIALFVVLSTSLEGPNNGKKSAQIIPNTLALVAWEQKPTIGHLSDLINSRTEGNILNSDKRCIAHMNKFS